MISITAKEVHRLGNRVLVAFTDQNGKDCVPGGRYVDAADWDSDPRAVIARTAEYLDTVKPEEARIVPPAAVPIVMTASEIELKLRAIADAKK